MNATEPAVGRRTGPADTAGAAAGRAGRGLRGAGSATAASPVAGPVERSGRARHLGDPDRRRPPWPLRRGVPARQPGRDHPARRRGLTTPGVAYPPAVSEGARCGS
ncbi:hypothetical protein FTX61_17305 [Nitriliruptoraceae bacterium ZYF776]|nr:hypothetical protein [Profundirhabdus halotolerans]